MRAASSSSDAERTMLMPLPPPPAAALMSSGKPIASASASEGVDVAGRHHRGRDRHAVRCGEIARRNLVAHQRDGLRRPGR